MPFRYQVTFTPGKYRYTVTPSGPGPQSYMIGHIESGDIVGFAFKEEAAKHICLALNLVDNYINGDAAGQWELLKQLERLHN